MDPVSHFWGLRGVERTSWWDQGLISYEIWMLLFWIFVRSLSSLTKRLFNRRSYFRLYKFSFFRFNSWVVYNFTGRRLVFSGLIRSYQHTWTRVDESSDFDLPTNSTLKIRSDLLYRSGTGFYVNVLYVSSKKKLKFFTRYWSSF